MKKNKHGKVRLQLNRQAIAKLSNNEMRVVQGGTGVMTGTIACTTIVASGGGGSLSICSGRDCTMFCIDIPYSC